MFEMCGGFIHPLDLSDISKLSSQEASVTVEGQVLPKINLQRTGTYPVQAKGRHQGWLGSLAELMEPYGTSMNQKK